MRHTDPLFAARFIKLQCQYFELKQGGRILRAWLLSAVLLPICSVNAANLKGNDVITDPLWAKFVVQVTNNFYKDISANRLNEICIKHTSAELPSAQKTRAVEQCMMKALAEIDPSSSYLSADDFAQIATSTHTAEATTSSLIRHADTLVLKIAQFAEDDPNELAAPLLRELHQFKPDKVVIDLRGNPGGLLTVVAHFGSYFVPAGETMLLTTARTSASQVTLVSSNDEGKEQSFTVQIRKALANAKLYVLIDRTTGSGAEAFALLLKAKRGATLIGEKTIGNADIHTVLLLTMDKGLKLKTAEMRIPEQASWAGKGVTPDFSFQSFAETNQLANALLR